MYKSLLPMKITRSDHVNLFVCWSALFFLILCIPDWLDKLLANAWAVIFGMWSMIAENLMLMESLS